MDDAGWDTRRSSIVDRLRAVIGELSEDPRAIPPPTPARGPVELTIGIATYDDFDGAWFTIESLCLHHPQWMDSTEIILLDNHPEAPTAALLSRLAGQVPNARYLPVTTVRSTAVRDLLFRHANGAVVLVLDSHVLLAAGALDALLAYFRA